MSLRKRFMMVWVVGLALAGCGAPNAEAPRDNVQAVQLKTFPKANWRLINNRLFLWREDVTPEQISRAQAIGKEIDELDGQAMPLNRRHKVLEDQIAIVQKELKPSTKSLQKVNPQLTTSTKDLTAAQKDLEAAQKTLTEEKGKPAPDVAAVQKLELQVAELNGRIAILQKQVDWFKAEKERLEKDISTVKLTLTPLQEEMEALETKKLEIELAGRARVDEIMKVTDWYKDQPTAVAFQFESNGTIHGSISGWNLSDGMGPRSFASKVGAGRKPTMGKIKYEDVGGIFEFEVYVYADDDQKVLRETYAFRVGRIKYEVADGRNFFGGEITRTKGTEVRKGYAKLVDRIN